MSGVRGGWWGCGKGGVGRRAIAVWCRNLVNISLGLYGIRPAFSHPEVIDDCLNVAIRILCRA